jgi:hypothetical protein
MDGNTNDKYFNELVFIHYNEKKASKGKNNKKKTFRPITSYSYRINATGYSTLDNNDNKVFLYSEFGLILYPDFNITKISDLVTTVKSKGWHAFSDLKKKLFIAIKPIYNSKIDYGSFLEKTIYSINTTIDNSLNSKNESIKKTQNFINFARENNTYDLSLEKTLINISRTFEVKYGSGSSKEITDIRVFKHDNSNNSWCLLHGNDDSYIHNMVQTKIEKIYNNRSNDAYLSYEGRMPITFKDDDCYHLLVPVAKSYEKIYFRYIFLITHKKPIDEFVLTNLNSLISDYFNRFIESEKFALLSNLQSIALNVSLSEQNSKLNDTKKQLEDKDNDSLECLRILTTYAFKEVVNISNAYSATMRLYDPSKGALILFVDCFNTEESDGEPGTDLLFSDFKSGENGKSINCQVFTKTEMSGKAIYATNQRVKQAIKRRPQTVAELCMPLYYKLVKIGTVNFESPIKNGFDSECHLPIAEDHTVNIRDDSFLYSVKIMLENYYALLRERNDTKYLSRFLNRESNFHDLKNIIGSKGDLNNQRTEILRLLGNIRTLNEINQNSVSSLACIKKLKDQIIEERKKNAGDFAEDIYKQKELRIILNKPLMDNPEKYQITSRTEGIIKDIYKNLLVNFLNYSSASDGDTLLALYDEKTGFLRFNQISKKPMPKLDNNLMQYFETPISMKTSEYEAKTKSGLFIVGALVRQLGGYIFPDIDDLGFMFGFRIEIYLGGKNKS